VHAHAAGRRITSYLDDRLPEESADEAIDFLRRRGSAARSSACDLL
jgi:hypothetical protein